MKKPVVIISGPTAVGKSELSIALAKKVGGEVVSADSMQVYKGMDIGTAKLSKEEMGGIRHHLIDILEPSEDFNVVRFKEMSRIAMEGIYERGRIPILTGGTGFYIQSVLYDIDFMEHGENERKALEEYARENGGESLYGILEREDPITAKTIHKNNIKKVIRAIEFHRETGMSLALHNEEQRRRESPYNFAYFVLTCDRGKLYERIDRRVELMMEQGLLEEAAALRERGLDKNHTSMAGLGYRQLFDYLEGKCSLSESIDRIKTETRHFAKRQLTWFRREKDIIWLDKDKLSSMEEQLEFMEGHLLEKGIVDLEGKDLLWK